MIGRWGEGMSTMVYPLDDEHNWRYVSSGVRYALIGLHHDFNLVSRLPDIKTERETALGLVEAAPNLAAKKDLVRLMREYPDTAVVVSI